MRTSLLFTMLFLSTFAVAQSDTYHYKSSGCNLQDMWLFFTKNCTSYAAWKVNEANDNSPTSNFPFYSTMTGSTPSTSCTLNEGRLGNACRWAMRLAANGYYVSDIATPGAIAHWNANEPGAGSVGHVAYVESVNSDGKANISEYNITPCTYGTRTVTAPRYIRFNRFMVVNNITINPNPIVQGQGVTVTLQVKNNFNEACTANFRCALYNSNNQFVGEIQAPSTVSFAASETRTLTFSKTNVSSAPGSYKIWIESRVASNSPWTLLHKPNASSTVNVNIVAGLNVTPSSLTYTPVASTKTASIQAGVNWTASKSQPWIIISPASGSANTTVQMNISVTANTGQTSRTGTVTISGGGLTRTVTVTQDGTNITVSPTSLSYLPAASTKTASIQSTVAWMATKNQSWVTISPSSGNANTTTQMNISVSANTSQSSRSGTVTITGGGITRTITVSQAGVAISVSPTSRSVAKTSGSTTFSISSNVSWSASDNASWLTLSPATGTGNATLTASFSTNTSSASRTATITITGGGLSRTCTVTQAGNSVKGEKPQNVENRTMEPSPVLSNQLLLYPNPAIDQTQVRFSTKEGTEAVLSVVDQSGKAVYQNQANVASGECVWTVSLTGWAAGQYTALVSDGHTFKSARFIVLR